MAPFVHKLEWLTEPNDFLTFEAIGRDLLYRVQSNKDEESVPDQLYAVVGAAHSNYVGEQEVYDRTEHESFPGYVRDIRYVNYYKLLSECVDLYETIVSGTYACHELGDDLVYIQSTTRVMWKRLLKLFAGLPAINF